MEDVECIDDTFEEHPCGYSTGETISSDTWSLRLEARKRQITDGVASGNWLE